MHDIKCIDKLDLNMEFIIDFDIHTFRFVHEFVYVGFLGANCT